MHLGKQFPSEAERNEAIVQMKNLEKSECWRFLVNKIIQPDIEEITEEILDTIFEDLNIEKDFKRKRAYWIILSQLPTKIIEALEEGEDNIPDFDPYPKVEDIEK